MLDKNTPADIISILYPNTQTKVRIHKHTDNGSIWIVGADICNILGITNISYIANKMNNTYKHCVKTKGGKQSVIWFNIDSVYNLCREHNAIDLINWLRFTVLQLPNNTTSEYVFNDPVIIERSTLSKMLEVMEELRIQNVI